MTDFEPSPPEAAIQPVVADLGETGVGDPAVGDGGAIWSLPHGGDLDVNLVRLRPQGMIGEHANHEVDVLIFVRSGSGYLTIEGGAHVLRNDVLVLVPRGARRSITAGAQGIMYLSIHRGRGPLGISARI